MRGSLDWRDVQLSSDAKTLKIDLEYAKAWTKFIERLEIAS
jgi:hypothetical protein